MSSSRPIRRRPSRTLPKNPESSPSSSEGSDSEIVWSPATERDTIPPPEPKRLFVLPTIDNFLRLVEKPKSEYKPKADKKERKDPDDDEKKPVLYIRLPPDCLDKIRARYEEAERNGKAQVVMSFLTKPKE